MVHFNLINCQLSMATTIDSISNTQVDVVCNVFAKERKSYCLE